MSAPVDWLTGPRPPAPFAESSVVFEDEFADRFAAAMRDFDPTSGDLFDPPTVRIKPVKPPRWSRRWIRENLTWRRQVAGGLSGLVLMASLIGRWYL